VVKISGRVCLLRHAAEARYAVWFIAIVTPTCHGCTGLAWPAKASERDAKVVGQTGATAKGRLVETLGGTLEEMSLKRSVFAGVDWPDEDMRKRKDEESGIERETHRLERRKSLGA
jgi:hypothetical protein